MRIFFLSALVLASCVGFGQKECFTPLPNAVERLSTDLKYLSSDKLEGRAPGEEGGNLAAYYIANQFSRLELPGVWRGDFLQPFEVPVDAVFGIDNVLSFDENELKLNEDYYPTRFTINGEVKGEAVYVKYGMVASEINYDDYKKLKPKKLEGKIFVMDVSSPDGIHPHSAYLKYHDLGDRITMAKEKGAIAVVLVNMDGSANDIAPTFKTLQSKGLPVVFVTNNEMAKKLKKAKNIDLQTEVTEKKITTYNVAAHLDNGAKKTVIIGAHYDHLGFGNRSSLAADKGKVIHNGADDNASGTAALIEIARNIAKNKEVFKAHNYVFVAFSAEEMGLLGSDYFVDSYEHIKDIKYMLNMDMVGRLEDMVLAVNGVGTSGIWRKLVEDSKCSEIKVKTSLSGVGPSDHTNFYYKDIPVLHFFTGTHSDYHKPSDDFEKLNIKGEAQVVDFILQVIYKSQRHRDMLFAKTTEASSAAPKFSVTLGVMPDYMYEGEGMRIDGVNDGKPAQKAGLITGDVVIQLGDVKVVDMMSYMKALGQFKKGDNAKVVVKRGKEKVTKEVKF